MKKLISFTLAALAAVGTVAGTGSRQTARAEAALAPACKAAYLCDYESGA
ncbi:MAG: hypothetical protein K2H43_00195 [Clostridia bacterium]|nr:hypothetical protein [Clostridia bacterium]